ncbi:TRADD-N-associated membrane domain-containing protein [Streptomyces fungicidicus]
MIEWTVADTSRDAAEAEAGKASGHSRGHDPFFSGPMWLLVAMAVVLALGMLWVIWQARHESQSIEQGRERVREAEQALQGALSGSSEVTDSPRVPGAREGESTAGDADSGTEAAAEASADARSLALARLWSLTHQRLDLYHEIATHQAKRSFTSAQVAMGAGFLLLLMFVGIALRASSTAGAIVAGGLGAVSAALAGFISKTFVKSQQTAAEHMKAYFDQPLEFSRYLAAERLLADAKLGEERRAEVVGQLVQTIAGGPAGSAPVDAGGLAQQLQELLPGQQ